MPFFLYTANRLLNKIKHIFARYTDFLKAVLTPLGAWGVFAIAAIDGSFLGMPVDLIVAGYVYQNRSRMLLYVLMAAAGSLLGSLVIYGIGYRGGITLLRKRMSPERFDKIHAGFEKHPFLGLMIPAMLPPPTPFKLFVLAAGAAEMSFVRFAGAIFAGRFLRFLIVGILTLRFGPEIVHSFGSFMGQHWQWVLAVILVGLIIWLARRRMGRPSEKPTT